MAERHFSLPGLLISNIDIEIDSIDDTFGVSISVSTILLGWSIKSSIDDTDCRTRMSMVMIILSNRSRFKISDEVDIGRPYLADTDTMCDPVMMAAYPTIRQMFICKFMSCLKCVTLSEINFSAVQ